VVATANNTPETRWLSYYAKKTQVADDPCLLKMNENGVIYRNVNPNPAEAVAYF